MTQKNASLPRMVHLACDRCGAWVSFFEDRKPPKFCAECGNALDQEASA